MKNQNTPWRRAWRWLLARWRSEDFPGAEPRFQLLLLAKDIAVFLALPLTTVLIYSALASPRSSGAKSKKAPEVRRVHQQATEDRSQIIEFGSRRKGSVGIAGRRAPGGLVRARLLNVVETYNTAPVHAQILDSGLGAGMRGGILIGDASPDTNFDRISISFRFARDPGHDGVAFPISARALSLDGTFGLEASKKEGYLNRSTLGAAAAATPGAQGRPNSTADIAQILLRALTAGLAQEFSAGTQIERNRAQVLALPASTEFFVELTDFFSRTGQ